MELELIKKIHSGSDETCYAGILTAWDLQNCDPFKLKYAENQINHTMYDKLFPFSEFYSKCKEVMNNGLEDTYFTVNSFYRRNKNSHDVRHLNCFVLDFDYYKIEKYKDLSADQFYQKIKKKFLFEPTAVVSSGRGLYVLYSFQHCSYHMAGLYKSIYKELQKRYACFGMDPKATHITQVIRMPGTINTHTLETVTVLELNDTDYTIQQFAEELLPFTQEEVKLHKKEKKKVITKTINQAYRDPIFRAVYRDFEKLISMRNKAMMKDGYRETLLYLIREYATWSGCSINESVKLAKKLNNQMLCPMSEAEVEKQCRPSQHRRRTGIDKIIDNLQITIEEQSHLEYLKRTYMKKALYAKKQRYNKLTNRSEKQEAILQRRTAIIELKRQGFRNKAIAERLELDKSTVTRDLQYINHHKAQFWINKN